MNKDLKEVVKFIIEGIEAGITRSFTDIAEALQALFPAINGIKNVKIADMTPADHAELVGFVKTEFDIPNDRIEVVVEQALKLVDDAIQLVQLISAVKSDQATDPADPQPNTN